MRTNLLLSTSAVVMGAAGIAALFLPHELLAALGLVPTGTLPVLVQLLAAPLLAFAMLNWMARGSLIGGIYNRPLAVGNVTHFVIGALATGKAVLAGERRLVVILIAVIYVLFALAFAALLFQSPVKRDRA